MELVLVIHLLCNLLLLTYFFSGLVFFKFSWCRETFQGYFGGPLLTSANLCIGRLMDVWLAQRIHTLHRSWINITFGWLTTHSKTVPPPVEGIMGAFKKWWNWSETTSGALVQVHFCLCLVKKKGIHLLMIHQFKMTEANIKKLKLPAKKVGTWLCPNNTCKTVEDTEHDFILLNLHY